MTIEAHVTSFELSKRLKELLGLRKTLFYYHDKSNNDIENYEILYKDFVGIDVEAYETIQRLYPAYLASELGEIMNCLFVTHRNPNTKNWIVSSSVIESHTEKDMKEANARALMLIHLIEQKLITI